MLPSCACAAPPTRRPRPMPGLDSTPAGAYLAATEGTAMGGKTLIRRALALLAAAGLFAVLVAGISADEGDEGAAAARMLGPTEVVAEIPEEYGTLFQIQWGGGSLFQLAGRLASQGCAMNTLWVHDGGQWHPYNRYDVPRDAALIQEFIRLYERNLPAGTFYATCADRPDEQNLQPTQIVADIAEEYDTLFSLQWGGGSLLHLKGRLATMGCVVNNISFSDPATNTQYIYNQYNSHSTDPQNQQFLQTFTSYIPAGTLSADCYNVCDVSDQGCLSFEELWEQIPAEDREDILWLVDGLRSALSADIPCDDSFHPQVKEQVLPYLPIHPNACIIKQVPFRNWGFNGTAIGYPRLNTPPFVFLTGSREYHRSDAEYELLRLKTEIHELCHINQRWHAMQALGPELHTKYAEFRNLNHSFNYFYTSEHGTEFIDMVGFTVNKKGTEEYEGFWRWNLAQGNIYRNIHFFNPVELSAELCAMYFLDKMGLESSYRYEEYHPEYNVLLLTDIRDFDVSPYLTPEIVEWLETYMILPDIEEGVEGDAE